VHPCKATLANREVSDKGGNLPKEKGSGRRREKRFQPCFRGAWDKASVLENICAALRGKTEDVGTPSEKKNTGRRKERRLGVRTRAGSADLA